ncbi:bifunctional 2-polyprenyl-6-hydroxyphenol methylase/3-demethylubiquinol 3-O-methyltransferase UbiG [Geobacter sp. SVR]|uniref:class I SAM-dependent methyltransferase n=1 Tax=Geobacter sp. SVR TaxID=2495594 RepID=UPI00143F025B|nr:methyltransferase domain-containing protein [Geobacter sp. SVR]BCS52121.1 hypothetical protein GSVR_04290 [Geobacter sp. SVR]GCF86576.1 hypothetical protein GSbR_31760 [Geobacter sp. SVR]
MLPPRYLLREDVVLRRIDHSGNSSIADIGCGGAEILIPLSRLGHHGIGYDPSPVARACARQRLAETEAKGFTIIDAWPSGMRFEVVLLLEVLGYADDQVELLSACRKLLVPGGTLFVSFVRTGAGYDPLVVQQMRCFSSVEVRTFLKDAGFRDIEIVNYGYPLANTMVGIMNALHGFSVRRTQSRGGRVETGLFHRSKWLAPLGIISNRWTIKPFVLLQRLFAHTEQGNGFVVRAKVG